MKYGSGAEAQQRAMTSHVPGGLAGSQRTLLRMQHRTAGGRHARYLESMTSHQNADSAK